MGLNDRVHWFLQYLISVGSFLLVCSAALAHDVGEGDKAFVQGIDGPAFAPFVYLGAKHMVTGYDHVLFLIGVVYFLHRARDVVLYVSLFTLGHSLTLMAGVLIGIGVNPSIIDTIIGVSVAYKGIENINGFRRIGLAINTKLAVLVFGLFHGLGLATKIIDLNPAPGGLLVNLIGFNLGVELGQVLVLVFVVALLNLWRGSASFVKWTFSMNVVLITAGVLLVCYHLTEYFSS